MIPSLSTGIVGSRFVSQDEVDTARARRDEQWKAAYARLGQEPPPQQQEDSYDGRSLAEKLAANRIAKQEEWEEKTKLANQFRALEEDEIMFLDSIRERQEEEERQRKEKDGEEVRGFKEAVAARASAANNPPPILGRVAESAPPLKPLPVTKKDPKKVLKGVVVKKKTKTPIASASSAASVNIRKGKDKEGKAKGVQEDSTEPDSKRRRIT